MITTSHLVGDPHWAPAFEMSPNLTKICLETFLQDNEIYYDMHVHYWDIEENFAPQELTNPLRGTLMRLWEEAAPEAFRD